MRDTDLPYGVGVLVARDGRFLCGKRSDTGEIGSPGGHIERGETPEQAAVRETQEEFGITPRKLRRVGCLRSPDGLYLPTMVFVCTDYEGIPKCGDAEMSDPEFMDVRDLDQLDKVYPAFDDAINLLIDRIHCDGKRGNPYRDKEGKFSSGNGAGDIPLDMDGEPFAYPRCWLNTDEYARVNSEINGKYHMQYDDKPFAVHKSYDRESDTWKNYYFENHGYGDYNFFMVRTDRD